MSGRPTRAAALALLLLAVGCTMGAGSSPPPASSAPLLDLDCPVAAPPPRPLPALRTIDALAAWAVATERARERDASDLEVCRDRLHLLESWARDALRYHAPTAP